MSSQSNWQNRLQFFMKGGIVLLVIVFVGISAAGMWQIKKFMDRSPEIPVNTAVISKFSADPVKQQQAICGLMESYIVSSRYHEARILTMINVWTQYLGFLTGMILAFIGSIFILGKIKEDVSTIDMKDVVKFTVTSSSPGIILAFFGTLLMLMTINVKHELKISDDAVYLKPQVNVNLDNLRKIDKPADWNAPAAEASAKSAAKQAAGTPATDSIEIRKQKLREKYGK